ncbi:MAG: nucleotidyltransferase family protein [Actinomycetota bacterium]|nr:nucleotidyltransferase family protein [Actinomycetota bacterium]
MAGATEGTDVFSVARALLLDRAAGRAFQHLAASGVPSILLKGATIATWLYTDGSARPYRDIDLLVSPADFDRAINLLAELGYVLRVAGADASELGPKELELVGPGNVCIDLHHGLLGAEAPPDHCWNVLSGRTIRMSVGGAEEVRVLDVPARAMHLALHAAQNGPVDRKAINDLERGLATLDRSDWVEATKVAEEIGALEAFAAGLRILPAGRVLADDLALTRTMSVELALRTRSVTQNAIFFERLADTAGARNKIRLLVRKMFPTAATLRLNSPLANRGRLGLLCAWAVHPFSVAVRFVPAFLAWFQARRSTSVRRDSTAFGDQ